MLGQRIQWFFACSGVREDSWIVNLEVSNVSFDGDGYWLLDDGSHDGGGVSSTLREGRGSDHTFCI